MRPWREALSGGALPLALLRVAVAALVITLPALHAAPGMADLPAVHRPLGAGWLVPWISPAGATAAWWAVMLGAALGGLGLSTRLGFGAVTLGGLYLLAIPQLRGGVQHYHHLVWFSVLLAVSPCADALAPGRWWPAPGRSLGWGLPVRAVWLLIALIFFFPGLHKVLAQGPGWAGDNLRWLLQWKWAQAWDFEPIVRLDRYPTLLWLGGLAVLAFELLFPLALLHRWTRALFVAGALVFHASTLLLLDIDFYVLWCCYGVFLPDGLVRSGAWRDQHAEEEASVGDLDRELTGGQIAVALGPDGADGCDSFPAHTGARSRSTTDPTFAAQREQSARKGPLQGLSIRHNSRSSGTSGRSGEAPAGAERSIGAGPAVDAQQGGPRRGRLPATHPQREGPARMDPEREAANYRGSPGVPSAESMMLGEQLARSRCVESTALQGQASGRLARSASGGGGDCRRLEPRVDRGSDHAGWDRALIRGQSSSVALGAGERPWRASAVVAALLLAGVVTTGLMGVTQGWPFACYPAFEQKMGPWMPTLLLVAVDADGAERELPERLLADADRSQVWYSEAWGLAGLYGVDDPKARRRMWERVRGRPGVAELVGDAVELRFYRAELRVDRPELRRGTLIDRLTP